MGKNNYAKHDPASNMELIVPLFGGYHKTVLNDLTPLGPLSINTILTKKNSSKSPLMFLYYSRSEKN